MIYQYLNPDSEIYLATEDGADVAPVEQDLVPGKMAEIYAFQSTSVWRERFRKKGWPQTGAGFGGSMLANFFYHLGDNLGLGSSAMLSLLEVAGVRKKAEPKGMAIDRGNRFEDEAREKVQEKLNGQFLPLCLSRKGVEYENVSLDGYGYIFDKEGNYAGEALTEIKVPMAKFFDDNYGHLDGFVATRENASEMGKAFTNGYYHQAQYQISFTSLDRLHLFFYSPEQDLLLMVTVMRDDELIAEIRQTIREVHSWAWRIYQGYDDEMPATSRAMIEEYFDLKKELAEVSPAYKKIEKRIKDLQSNPDFMSTVEEFDVPFIPGGFITVVNKEIFVKEIKESVTPSVNWEALAKFYLKERIDSGEINLSPFIEEKQKKSTYHNIYEQENLLEPGSASDSNQGAPGLQSVA